MIFILLFTLLLSCNDNIILEMNTNLDNIKDVIHLAFTNNNFSVTKESDKFIEGQREIIDLLEKKSESGKVNISKTLFLTFVIEEEKIYVKPTIISKDVELRNNRVKKGDKNRDESQVNTSKIGVQNVNAYSEEASIVNRVMGNIKKYTKSSYCVKKESSLSDDLKKSLTPTYMRHE